MVSFSVRQASYSTILHTCVEVFCSDLPFPPSQAVAIAFGVSLFSLSQSGPKDGEETNTKVSSLIYVFFQVFF